MPNRFVGVEIDAVKVAVVATRIDAIAVHSRHPARPGEHHGSRSVIREVPEFLTTREIEAPQAFARLIVPIEQVDLAIFHDWPGIAPIQGNGPQDLRAVSRP
jgi:hypothetical protein